MHPWMIKEMGLVIIWFFEICWKWMSYWILNVKFFLIYPYQSDYLNEICVDYVIQKGDFQSLD